MLLNTLQLHRTAAKTKTYPAPNANSAKIEQYTCRREMSSPLGSIAGWREAGTVRGVRAAHGESQLQLTKRNILGPLRAVLTTQEHLVHLSPSG